MGGEFDDRLKNQVRQVFEHLDDGAADQGWLLLRGKYPEKKKDRPVIWFWLGTAAALLLLFLGTGIWLIEKTGTEKKLAGTQIIKTREGNKLVKSRKPLTTDQVSVNYKNSIAVAAKVAIKPGGKLNQSKGRSRHLVAASSPSLTAINAAPGILKATKATNGPPNNSEPILRANDIAANNDEELKIPALLIDTGKKGTIANTKPVAVAKPTKKPSFLDKPNLVVNSKQHTQDSKTGRSVVLAVYAGPFFNYAKGSNNQVNAGAGVSSDIRLGNNIRLSTGVAIAQNNLSYNSQPAQAAIQKYISAVNLSVDRNNGSSAVSNSLPVSAATFKSYDAQLVALDVPVNVKYGFNHKKNDTYLSVGLSSGTFINQSYTYQYSNNSSLQQTGTTNSFGNFYFAKTLNVSFGVSYPMGKNQRLIIEPFLKYPLDGLGEQQIRFGAGGINLKFNFKP